MPFEIVRNDITNMRVDAIVNTANPSPVIGSGVDAAIHAKAGPMLLAARKLIGIIRPGEACVTPGFGLPCKCVIHTVGPIWKDGDCGEAYLLRQCYEYSLKLAFRHRCKSVAFPLISSGNYGFPKELVLQVAVETIREFLEEHEMHVYLVVFGKASLELSSQLVNEVRSFIDDAYAQELEKAEYSFSVSRDFDFVREKLEKPEDKATEPRTMPDSLECAAPCAENRTRSAGLFGASKLRPKEQTEAPHFDEQELLRIVQETDAGFSETLLRLIDRSGKKDSDVYKRANIDRKLFSKIRNNPQYKPSKATALAFAIALELNLEETKDFIGRAGYALSRSNKFDIIIAYYIAHERYDIYEINMMLFEFDQSLLGA